MRILPILLALALLAALTGCTQRAEKEALPPVELEITCFSAGAADAFLLTTAGSAVLIDCGEKSFGKDLAAELEARGVTRLDYLIVTHFDKDHVGGAAKVLQSVEVGQVLQSNYPKDSTVYENYLEALAATGTEAMTLRADLSFELDGLRYMVDAPKEQEYAEDPSNNSSLIVSVEDGACRFLFMGDAETLRIREYLQEDQSSCDWIKLPHHGRDEPLLETLLKSCRPADVLITSSDEEPESETVTALAESLGARVWLTRLGAVILRCDGVSVVSTYRE